jgi:hypothetical protein
MNFRSGILIALLVVFTIQLHAQEERYDYDETGKLIRVVNDTYSVTYQYDSVGNILQVSAGDPSTLPDVDVDLGELRCGMETQVSIVGENLDGARVASTASAIRISNIRYLPGEITFILHLDCSIPMQDASLVISTAAGDIVIPLSVAPILPSVFVTPSPLAVPPGGSIKPFLLRLSHADIVEHAFTLTSTNEDIATIISDSLFIPAGETEITGQLSGDSAGQAVLNIHSSTLGNTSVPIFVTENFAGVNTSRGPILGVDKTRSPTETERDIDIRSAAVGLHEGVAIVAVEPFAILQGAVSVPLDITGFGLEQVTTVEIIPADDLYFDEPVIDPDGEMIELSITVAEQAEPTIRRVIARRADGSSIPPLEPESDRFVIARQAPSIESVSPIVLYPSDTAVPFTIRGQRLREIVSIDIDPPENIVVEQTEGVEDGTRIDSRISVAPDAEPGARRITVNTLGGVSASTAAADTIHVVLENEAEIDNLTAAVLGLERQSEPVAQEYPTQLTSTALGIVRNAAVTAIEPGTGVIGTTVPLVITGQGLADVNAIDVIPADGIAVQNLVVESDTSVTAELDIASDAVMSLRDIRVRNPNGRIMPAGPEARQFKVVPHAPQLDSVSPQHVHPGDVVTLELRGENFREAAIAIEPSTGVTINGYTVSADETVLHVQVSVDESAPTGPRYVEISTPGGSSGSVATVSNSFRVVDEQIQSYPALAGSALGVVLENETIGSEPETIQILATPLGVSKQGQPIDAETTGYRFAHAVGVVTGPYAAYMQPASALPGEDVAVQVYGHELEEGVTVRFMPADGVMSTSSPIVSPDRTSLVFSAAVAADAGPGVRRLILETTDGAVIPFNDLKESLFMVGHGVPEIHSIEPILAGQGDTVQLLVRGENLFDAYRVRAEPATGLQFSPSINVNEAGTELTVGLAVDEAAPLGSRVIRVEVPGAITTDIPEPANTFTIYSSVPE